jgi:hypothetical protein
VRPPIFPASIEVDHASTRFFVLASKRWLRAASVAGRHLSLSGGLIAIEAEHEDANLPRQIASAGHGAAHLYRVALTS